MASLGLRLEASMIKGIVSAEGVRLPDSLMVKVAEWQSQHFSQLESFGAASARFGHNSPGVSARFAKDVQLSEKAEAIGGRFPEELRKKWLLDRLLTYELYVLETRATRDVASLRPSPKVQMDPFEAFDPELDGESLDSDDEAYVRQVEQAQVGLQKVDIQGICFLCVEGWPQRLVDALDWAKLALLMRLSEIIAPQWPHHHQLDANSPEECLFALQRSMPLDTHYRARSRLLERYALEEEIPLAAYQRYHLYLQQVQLRRGSMQKRFVLKGQLIHLHYMAQLRSVFPSAHVVWSHRPAEEVVGSLCSLRKSQQEVFLNEAPDKCEDDLPIGAILAQDLFVVITWA
eukprot:s3247_g12.t1